MTLDPGLYTLISIITMALMLSPSSAPGLELLLLLLNPFVVVSVSLLVKMPGSQESRAAMEVQPVPHFWCARAVEMSAGHLTLVENPWYTSALSVVCLKAVEMSVGAHCQDGDQGGPPPEGREGVDQPLPARRGERQTRLVPLENGPPMMAFPWLMLLLQYVNVEASSNTLFYCWKLMMPSEDWARI
jgi:hypothetical protein